MNTNITALASVTPATIVAALRRGDGALCRPVDRPIRADNGLHLSDGKVGPDGKMYPARNGGGYSAEGVSAPAGCEWVQAMRGCPAYHGTAVLVRVSA